MARPVADALADGRAIRAADRQYWTVSEVASSSEAAVTGPSTGPSLQRWEAVVAFPVGARGARSSRNPPLRALRVEKGSGDHVVVLKSLGPESGVERGILGRSVRGAPRTRPPGSGRRPNGRGSEDRVGSNTDPIERTSRLDRPGALHRNVPIRSTEVHEDATGVWVRRPRLGPRLALSLSLPARPPGRMTVLDRLVHERGLGRSRGARGCPRK